VSAAQDEKNPAPKIFIIKTEYAYVVSPSPAVVPRGCRSLVFENLTGVQATVTLQDKDTAVILEPEKPQAVPLPDGKRRVIVYRVEVGGLSAKGNSSPIIIRDA
jgi:hypothetical protein